MPRKILVAAFGGVMVMLALAAPASADTQTFPHPTYQGNLLDWCRDWGTNCGKPAADAWCKAVGYQSATGFEEAHDVGAASPTRVIGSGAICDQASCDGFSYIACTKPDPTQTFPNPVFNGARLDWCHDWGTGCGKAAADAWCKSVGYTYAAAFSEAYDIGAATPTRLIGTGAICDQGMCDGFQAITCSK